MLKKLMYGSVVTCMLVNPFFGLGNSVLAAESASDNKIQAEIFVSASGSDANPGTYEKPLATLDGARKSVETINGNMTGDIYVFFEPGTYYTPNTVNFTTADSGTNGHHVVYKTLGAPGSANFVGGMKATSNWTEVQGSTDPNNPDSDMQQSLAGKIYKTNLSAQLGALFPGGLPATSGPLPNNANGKFDINTLYVNDTRTTQARTLNSNKYPVYPSTLLENPLYSSNGNYDWMQYKAGDASNIYTQALINAQTRGDLSLQIVANDIGNGRSWDSNTLPVQSINTATRTLTFNPNDSGTFKESDAAFSSFYAIGANSRYFLQGNLAYLDTPSEFYYNAKSGDLYYYPKPEETDLNAQDIVIPTTQSIVNINGSRTGTWDSTVITPVKNITFDGLGFKDTSFPDYYSPNWPWLQYGGARGFAFPSYAVNSSNPIYSGQSERPQFQVGNITIMNADSITITNAHIKNAGLNGVILKTGVTNSVVKNSLIEYCGNNGLDIQGGFPGLDGNSDAVSFTNHNLIENNVIHDLGQLILQASGVAINSATSNTVSHIEVYNSPRRAILLNSSDVQGWNNTGPSGSHNDSPTPYVLSRDQYAHDNTFSYIYIHDVQQDGTDDGGFMTAFLYYPGDNYSKPNYINQMVIDKVAYNPQMANQGMTNITPNNINFDMGWVGLEVSNVKSVNPQHYNIENDHLQDGQVKVTNSNFYFKNANDGMASFDDSKMDYANIGVLPSRFPSEFASAITNTKEDTPSNVYFGDNFENGLNVGQWSYSGALPAISHLYMSEGGIGGTASMEINSSGASKPVLYRNFSNNLNKIVSVKVFDNSSTDHTTYGTGYAITYAGKTFARADDGTNMVGLGIAPSATNGGKYYVMNVGGVETATSVLRTTGWHTLSFDYSTPGSIVLSVDGTVVNTLNSTTWANTPNAFNYVSLGSPDGTGDNFYDEFYIYGGDQAPAPGSISFPAPPPYDNSSDNIQQMNWNFEDNALPNGFTNFYGGALNVVANPDTSGNTSSKVLYQNPGGVAQYTKQTWSNYMLSFKWKLKGWDNSSDTAHVYDGFTVYVDTQQVTPTNANPGAYQVIFRRNLNGGISGGGAYPAGTPFFAINQHVPGDTTLTTAPVPAGFDPMKWHNFQIQVFGGKIGLVVDGTKVISYSSSAYTQGSIGFGTYNNTQYFDDIQVVSNPKYVNYASNLNLGNASLNGSFNPNYTTYMATVTNPAQPVTIIRPKVVLDSTSVAIKLNGTDITSNFTDDATPVSLNLIKGRNTLVLTQTTVAGSQDYTVYIDKPYTISSIAPVAPVTINVDSALVLPSTTIVTFDDNTQQTLGIKWDIIDRSLLIKPGTFIVNGQLVGVNGVISAAVTVNGLNAIGTLPDVTTVAGTAPVLAQTVSAQFTSGSVDLPLQFAELDSTLYANPGTFVAVATADGYEGQVLQKVTVLPSTPTLVSISAPEAINGVPNGTAKTAEALGLPAEVELLTESESVNASVIWNVASAEYNPSLTTGQTFTVSGTVALPEDVANPNNVPLTTSISVTVLPAPQASGIQLTGPITVQAGQPLSLTAGFLNVTESVYAQDLTINFNPGQLQFVSAEPLFGGFPIVGESDSAGVVRILMAATGSNNAFTGTKDLLKLNFKAVQLNQPVSTIISLSHVLVSDANGIETSIPSVSDFNVQITVAVVDKSALNAKIISAQALISTDYTLASWASLQTALGAAVGVNNNANATQAQVDTAASNLQDAIDGLVLAANKTTLKAKITDAQATVDAAKISPTRWGHYSQSAVDTLKAVISSTRTVAGDVNATQAQVDQALTSLQTALITFAASVNTTASVGDLALLASHYGATSATSTSSEWASLQMYDFDHDNKLDIADLAALAKKILGL